MSKKTEKQTGMMSLSSYDKNRENPFLEQAVETVNRNLVSKYKSATNTGEKAILKAFDDRTGEVLGHTQFVRQIEVDEEQFTKFYLSNFSAFFDLKPSAIRVFGYVLEQLLPNKDYFYIDISDALEVTKYKHKSSVYEGLASLIGASVIARGKNDNHYFINPMVVFNGNRITFAKTYVKKKKTSQAVNPNQLDMLTEIGMQNVENESKEI
jgi:hypothetical protein